MATDSLLGKPLTRMLKAEASDAARLAWYWAALGAILLASCGHLLIKRGLLSAGHEGATALITRIAHYILLPDVLIGLGIYGVGTLLWISAVSQRNISFLYPLTALNYVIVSVGGKLFFSEKISPGRWLGIAVVFAGVALLQLSARKDRP